MRPPGRRPIHRTGADPCDHRLGRAEVVPCFAYGCAINLFWRSGAVEGRTGPDAGALLSLFAILAMASFEAPAASIVGAFGVLILCLASLKDREECVAGARALMYPGEVRCAAYRVCIPWKLIYINVVCRLLQVDKRRLPVGWWILFVISLVPIAALAHHLVQRPARTAMRRWAADAHDRLTSVAKAPRRKIIVF